jgi:hypothetical protein
VSGGRRSCDTVIESRAKAIRSLKHLPDQLRFANIGNGLHIRVRRQAFATLMDKAFWLLWDVPGWSRCVGADVLIVEIRPGPQTHEVPHAWVGSVYVKPWPARDPRVSGALHAFCEG